MTLEHRVTFKKNKLRLDMRKQSKVLLKKCFKKSLMKANEMEAGKIYALVYKSDRKITDKHHKIAIIANLGRMKVDDEVVIRGVNLLYTESETQLRIMDRFCNKNVVNEAAWINDTLTNELPFALKDFRETRIANVFEIEKKKWGLVPLIKKEVFGVQPLLLKADYLEETAIIIDGPPVKKLEEEPLDEGATGDDDDFDFTLEEVSGYLESDNDDI